MRDKRRVAIIAPTEGGKTSLAVAHSLGIWKAEHLRTIAFDPWLREVPTRWGAHAWATDNWSDFVAVVLRVRDCVIVWDEATTNGGRDRENVGFFSEIRHRHAYLFCLGHDYATFLPVMRASLTDLFLAACDEEEADKWAKRFREPTITSAAPQLGQYQFVHKRAFYPMRTLKPTPAGLRAGLLLP